MKPAAHSFSLLLAAMVLADAAAQAGAAGAPDLLTHGTDQALWVATVVSNTDNNAPGERTVIRARGVGEQVWTHIADVQDRAVALASRRSELAVLLRGGDWRLVAPGDIRSGNRLPGGAGLIHIAGGGEALWAIGPSLPPLESPSTTATTAAGNPATQPNRPLALLELQGGDWNQRATLPTDLTALHASDFSMTIFESRPHLLIRKTPASFELLELREGKTLARSDFPAPSFTPGRFKLLVHGGRLTVWLARDSSPGVIVLRHNDGWSQPLELVATEMPAEASADVSSAFGRLRLLFIRGDGKLYEQTYSSDGVPLGAAAPAALDTAPGDKRIGRIFEIGAMVALVLVMLSTIRHRHAIREAVGRVHELHLSPLLPRLLAGVIDAVPLIAGVIIIIVPGNAGKALEERMNNPMVQLWSGLCVGVYLLHTTLSEVFFRRTLGKRLLGLRVSCLKGESPTAGAMIARNLLRLVDVVLLFPLALMIFSPLRQRIGDLAAGTLVVTDPSRRGEQSPPSE